MFSALGNIFSIKPRQAEQTDTRQAIRRHDPDYEQRRKKKESETSQALEEDGATVSVEALRIFLENFVRNNANGEAAEQASSEEQSQAEQNHEPADYKIQADLDLTDTIERQEKSGQAARAASTYENAAQTKEEKILFETTDQGAIGPTLDLSAADIRTIHLLIEDLKVLKAENIEYLQIERAATFLDSLVNAVSKTKGLIPSLNN